MALSTATSALDNLVLQRGDTQRRAAVRARRLVSVAADFEHRIQRVPASNGTDDSPVETHRIGARFVRRNRLEPA